MNFLSDTNPGEVLNQIRKNSPLIWSLLGVFSVGNPLIWKYSNFILSESLYISFSLLFFGFLINNKYNFNIKIQNQEILHILGDV